MLRKVKKFISDNQLFGERDKVLLAVSGGPDSAAMAHIMSQIGANFGICHVNFQLRGQESNGDEDFVRGLAEKYGAEIFVARASTQEYASAKGLSIEMAAREIRYAEFSRIMDQHGYTCTAVAHHQDDSIETMILNLTRGAGIKGLAGIKVKNGKTVRPLLCLTRSQIMQYIEQNHLQYRTDRTNLESEYARNKVRNLIMPVLEQINPSARASMSESLRYLAMAKHIYEDAVEKALQAASSASGQGAAISIPGLLAFPEPECLLHEAASRYGFSKSQCASIMQCLGGESGKQLISKTHRLIKDRDSLLIEPLEPRQSPSMEISPGQLETPRISTPRHTLELEIIQLSDFSPRRDPSTIYLDLEKLKKMHFPLEITGWRHGDTMAAFGGQKKKLSDIFTDSKLSISQKENAEVLRSGSQILWAIGIRASSLCAVGPNTGQILKITAK